MPFPRPLGPQRRHLPLMMAASVLAPALIFGAFAIQSYQSAMAGAEDRTSRRVAVLAEHVGRVLDNMELAFDLIEVRLEGESDAGILAKHTMTTKLLGGLRSGALQDVLMTDAAGRIIARSQPQVPLGSDRSDRDYFRAPLADGRIHVGEQIVTRTVGERAITISRRRAGGGIIGGIFYTRYFEELFATLAAAETGVITLYRADGRQLARHPPLGHPVTLGPETGFMRNIARTEIGMYRTISVADGAERMFAFHKVLGYPIFVAHGLDVADVRLTWLASIAGPALAAALAAATLMAFALLAMRREREAAIVASRLEAAVAARTAESQRANAAKSQFLAAASHDLRQPIQGVRLFLDVLKGRLTSPEDQKVLALAEQSLSGAEDLLSSLLDVSTLEAGTITPAPRPFPLNDLLTALTAELVPQAVSHDLGFRSVPTSAWVVSDPVLLARVLRNLLVNALRYTAAGSILLGCRLAGGNVRIEIWDTGIGIPDDKREMIFEEFVQLDNPERDRSKGLGLGLAVVRRMAALLGHEVGLRSRVGGGTVFWVTVRAAAPDEVTRPGREAAPQANGFGQPTAG